MKAAHARLASATDEDARARATPERRREPRVTAQHEAIVQFSDGKIADVQLTDVSMHGCCVKSEAEDLRIGRFVSIGIEDEPMLQAIIRWMRGGSAGMEFLHPIPYERTEWHDLMEMPF